MYPEHGATPEILLKNTDTAMYCAKRDGGNNYVFFNQEMNIAVHGRLVIEQSLRKVIEKKMLTKI